MKPAVVTTTMFGRYKLLGRIGEGGMAEVYRALMTGPEGFERELVLKRILPRLSDTGDFKTMFIREAKISALLLHPNIVQIYEFGEADGAYFIAMENVQGVTLREALTTLRREQRAMPYLVAADIARQICIGLDYAHTLNGPDGKALEIVHQDISPTNIMLAYTGTVKILDFGIARAASFAEEEAKKGLIKGKVSYLSPEQINVRPFDARADIFALGVVFHEMLTGRRLFQAKNDIGKMRQLLAAPIVLPSAMNAAIPRELDRIVMRALSIDMKERYQSSADMASDLERTLIAARYSSRELSKLLHGLFLPDEDPLVVVDTDDHRTVAMTGSTPGGSGSGGSGQTATSSGSRTAPGSGGRTTGSRSTSSSSSTSYPPRGRDRRRPARARRPLRTPSLRRFPMRPRCAPPIRARSASDGWCSRNRPASRASGCGSGSRCWPSPPASWPALASWWSRGSGPGAATFRCCSHRRPRRPNRRSPSPSPTRRRRSPRNPSRRTRAQEDVARGDADGSGARRRTDAADRFALSHASGG